MDLTQQILIVLAFFAALLFLVWFLRSKGLVMMNLPMRRSAPRRLKSIERLALTPQHSIHLIQFDDRVLVIGSSPAGCQLIAPSGDGAEASR